MGYAIGMEFVGIIYFVAMIPMAMRMCTPAIAATQFTIYMAVGNFGRPLGASLAGVTAGAGDAQLFYFSVAAIWAVAAVVAIFAKFPAASPEVERELTEHWPEGSGPHPIED
jgi:PAT family beta-lactamase induction signal transducer AmpG